MKPCPIFIFLVLIAAKGLAQTASTLSDSEHQKLDAITSRVRAGDYNALNEAASLPAPVAVPYLQFWTRPLNSSQISDAAGNALKQVSGAVEYLQQDMATYFSNGSVPVNDFDILGIIGSEEAAKAVAPYLFDQRQIDFNHDGRPYEICTLAESALAEMGFADAPKDTLQTPYVPRSTILTEWQKWAIAKGLVAKNWTTRMGAPTWMVRLDAMDKPVPTKPATKSPLQPTQTAIPSPSIASSSPVPNNTPPPSSSPAPSVAEITSSKSTLTIWGGVVLVLLVIGAVVIVLRKRP